MNWVCLCMCCMYCIWPLKSQQRKSGSIVCSVYTYERDIVCQAEMTLHVWKGRCRNKSKRWRSGHYDLQTEYMNRERQYCSQELRRSLRVWVWCRIDCISLKIAFPVVKLMAKGASGEMHGCVRAHALVCVRAGGCRLPTPRSSWQCSSRSLNPWQADSRLPVIPSDPLRHQLDVCESIVFLDSLAPTPASGSARRKVSISPLAVKPFSWLRMQ